MHVEYNAIRAIAILVTTALLLNAVMPTLAHAATYLQAAEVNADTLVRDAYVAVTYYDSKGKQKLEKGWIDAVGETSFTIRSGGVKDKKPITYDKVESVIMSDESTVPAKQMNEVNRFIRNMGIQLQEVFTVISRGQVNLQRSSKIRKGWYAHVTYTSKGEEEAVTGIITQHDSVHIVIRVQEEHALGILKTIAYKDVDTLVISQHAQSIDAWKNAKQTQRYLKNKYNISQPAQSMKAEKNVKQAQRHLENGYNTKVRVQASSIWKRRVVGRLVKMTPDTLVISRGGTFFQVPVSSISNFEVSLGQHRNTGMGTIIGVVIGVGILALSSRGIYDADDKINTASARERREWAKFAFILVAAPVVVLTTLIGTIIGYEIKSERWVKVSPHSLNLSLAPTSTKGLRAALTFNF